MMFNVGKIFVFIKFMNAGKILDISAPAADDMMMRFILGVVKFFFVYYFRLHQSDRFKQI